MRKFYDLPFTMLENNKLYSKPSKFISYDNYSQDHVSLQDLKKVEYKLRKFSDPDVTIDQNVFGWRGQYYLENPILSNLISLAESVTKFLSNQKELLERHLNSIAEINKDKFLGDSIFTTGAINRNCLSPYHKDGGHLEGCLNAMVTLKCDKKGGYLNFPEYELCVQNENNNLAVFDGREITHGVTPLVEGQQRYTIAFFVDDKIKE